MTAERGALIVAGFFVLLSPAPAAEASLIFHNANWLWFIAFVGLNPFQSGFTRFCPLELIFRKLGVKPAVAA